MDPLGLAFEIYDGIGRFRTMDGSKPVDASGELKGTEASDGPVKNAIELMRKLARADEVQACMARQWFRYAFGRARDRQRPGRRHRGAHGWPSPASATACPT